jgi:hypothetical protein
MGNAGYGSLLDFAFIDQAQPGDYLLVSIGSAGALEGRFKPEQWDQVRTFKSDPETAILYRLKQPPIEPLKTP